MKWIAITSFGIQLLLGNICMMPMTSAHSIQDQSSMQSTVSMQPMSSHNMDNADNESNSSHTQKGGCSGHCFSELAATPTGTAFTVQEIIASPIIGNFSLLYEQNIVVSEVDINPSPPGFLSMNTIVLRL